MSKRMVWFYVAAMIGGAIIGAIWGKLARAQEYPDEATKKCALLKAYHMNGDSMVRWGSIDLSKDKDPCPKTIRTIPITRPEQPRSENTNRLVPAH